ncbi:hypothetical protein F5Y13DRAFT_184684 [Hypoxylon sp. FL1857]|nr:hypothetical protein F5Y13DRAFT_184684 [Hypoxylon sp. FL1857]
MRLFIILVSCYAVVTSAQMTAPATRTDAFLTTTSVGTATALIRPYGYVEKETGSTAADVDPRVYPVIITGLGAR